MSYGLLAMQWLVDVVMRSRRYAAQTRNVTTLKDERSLEKPLKAGIADLLGPNSAACFACHRVDDRSAARHGQEQ